MTGEKIFHEGKEKCWQPEVCRYKGAIQKQKHHRGRSKRRPYKILGSNEGGPDEGGPCRERSWTDLGPPSPSLAALMVDLENMGTEFGG
jgi:hypothetical protein